MEKVQLALERLIPELRDLEDKGIFNKDEIHDIVAKRRAFEMGLAQGRGTKPADYLRYIEYERRLEKLRKARAARLQTESKKSLSDHSIPAHITQLHRLSVRRFPESLTLWDAFIAHALSQSSPNLVSRTLSSAIAMHPTHTPYWIMASQWESEGDRKGMGGGNAEAARRLCMRALRFLKGKKGEKEGLEGPEEAIWREWIRVEVSFVEKLRGRWQVLGLGKGKGGKEDIIRVKGASGEADEGDETEEEIQLPTDEDGDHEDAQLAEEMMEQAKSGQEALLDGAIVRLVIDNLLKSYEHSIFAYNLLLSILRPLASPLRLLLLQHVYTSLSTHITSSSPSYPAALHILATRKLYDVPFVPPKQSKKRKADEAQVTEPEDPRTIKVEGEKLVDAVGAACEEYWRVLKSKGKKGKGKEKEAGQAQSLWEQFCGWLEEMADETDDEDLLAFLSANLASALAAAPPSPFLSLVHLRHLLRTEAPAADIRSYAKKATKAFGSEATPPAQREQVWVARIETSESLSTSVKDVASLLTQAVRALPFSSKLWDLFADFAERTAELPAAVEQWYEFSIRRVLLTDAVPPASFESTFTDYAALPPRELLPRRYVHYLTTTAPASCRAKLLSLLSSAPALSLSFLSTILDPTGPALSSDRPFRQQIFERIVSHPEAGPEEWLSYAEELVRTGQVVKSQEVLRRAKGDVKLKRGEGELRRFEMMWDEVCRGFEH
ncbi:U3 snoRNP protein [Rhodotorula toruloides]